MPELPEVEAARRAIEDHCVGKKIVKAIIADDPKVIDGVSLDDFRASLEGKTIVAANRKGKNMWIELDSPPFPTFQFGMAGAIYIKGVAVTKYKRSAVKDDDEWPSKYSKVFLELDDGLELSFTDKRRFARVRSLKNPVSVPPISELGPDALLEPMTVDEFYKAFSKKKIGVKALLLDQSFISGIGNWIADEVLYQARIHPMQTASSISKEDCATLLKCIYEVTEFAVEVDADCSRFPSEWLFHYRWGKKPGKVNGKKIEFITAGGRTSAFVPDLQKMVGAESAKAAGKRQQVKVQRVKHNDSDGEDEEPEIEEAEAGKSKGKRRGTDNKRASTNKKLKGSNGDNDENDNDNDEGLKNPSEKAKQSRSSKGKGGNQEKKARANMAAKRKLEESGDDEDDDGSEGDDDNEGGKDRKLSSKTQSKGKKTTKRTAEPRQTRNKLSNKHK
ncbi:formamidopyrimidine-DNA glycosylase isoform X2 [Nicotiana tabacum]|uniref:Formamidopyrimidine-DNA glycosylase isoform X2 n=2 Tax=Nicotiana tabacum TaxID=4097 RepID=A0AC58UDK7_TOBAC|nr:formamidopyrimidine-DNA glycosylase isoform X2 [Nicotiana tomentosiformis]XP_016507217.1 PREDICTED: formamidopyrimidine-DNA glycosylase-like isoform X2 [Nicotiana tabacum]